MSKKYWDTFYKKKRSIRPSNFVKFCKKYIPKGSTILELGSGNGRDSYYLGKMGKVYAMDYAYKNKCNKTVAFYKKDLKEIWQFNYDQDVIYSRFFLHCLSSEEIEKLLIWSRGLFMAEFRTEGDTPLLYPNIQEHKRNLINGNQFILALMTEGYEIIYYKKGRGMAKYKNEDPLVVRVIARKK